MATAIRTIPVEQLLPGMYVVDLHHSWFEHSLWRRHFSVDGTDIVDRLVRDGVTRVSIDISRGIAPPAGLDPGVGAVLGAKSGTAPAADPAMDSVGDSATERIQHHPVSLAEERRRAGRLLRESVVAVQDLMGRARCGRPLEPGRLEPYVRRMVVSVARHPDALVPLARLKGRDAYPAGHAVACAALMAAFTRQQGAGEREAEALVFGALVKDIGQAPLDSRLQARNGPLTGQGRALVQAHVEKGLAFLEVAGPLPGGAGAVVLEHHERHDGSGYPFGRRGEAISRAGGMAAIADTYDAMTSDRPYRRAMAPVTALRQLYQEEGRRFHPELVAAFVHTVGVYPVGSLVRLESGHLGVVQENRPDDLLNPVVKIIFDADERRYVTPVQVDLARRHANAFGAIVRAESFETWGLSSLRWQPA